MTNLEAVNDIDSVSHTSHESAATPGPSVQGHTKWGPQGEIYIQVHAS